MSPAQRLLAPISFILAVICSSPVNGATLFDPALRFRTVTTEHFILYFHRGEDELAARLAVIAEDAWSRLQQPLGIPLQKRTHVVLVDQSELANGWAFPVPYNTVMVTTAWPPGSEFIGNTDDWLRLVFTHEFAHIIHLDRSGGWARFVRRIFGRTPLAFPNLYLPIWQIEGLATFEESQLAGEGRLHAGDFRAVELEAARARRLPSIDRVNGGLTSWPDGLAPYAYGAAFHAYLADRYGADTIRAVADRTARRVPFFIGGAYKGVYGRSLGSLWREYQVSVVASVEGTATRVEGTQLTRHGYSVIGPRFTKPTPSCPSCPAEIVYSVRTPHEFPALNAISVDGSNARQLATRYLGSTSGIGANVIVFDQQELRRNTGLYSDLFMLDRERGDVRRLTSTARLLDPDLSPDESSIVCVREGLGRRELVIVRLKADATSDVVGSGVSVVSGFSRTVTDVTTLISEADTQFNAPRWAPDGRRIAVERHVLGRDPEIVVVDAVTGAVRGVAAMPATRFVTPTWRPDGLAIVAAAAPENGTFDLYEFDVPESAADGTSRRLTHTTGGATWPDVSPDGSTLAFVGYTLNGFELFTLPYPTAGTAPGEPVVSGFSRTEVGGENVVSGFSRTDAGPPKGGPHIESYSYNPLPTLKPTSWLPVIEATDDEVRLGVATGGRDVLGYHAFAAAATWAVAGSSPASASPDWEAAYVYDRWQPTLFASASREAFGLDELESGMLWPVRRVRVSNHVLISAWRAIDDNVLLADGSALKRTAARFGWATLSAREFGFSISRERGVVASATAELIREALGASGNSTTLTADFRSYIPAGPPHHVLALRAAGGVSNGDLAVRRVFSLGGAAPNLGLLDFGSAAFSLLRGFEQDTAFGTRIAVLNADYRWPIARPERGVGTLPVFLHTIHAAVFGDAGHAWEGRLRTGDLKMSTGAELSADLVLAYSLRIAFSVGAAWTRDNALDVNNAPAFYVRVERAF
jgi:WD40 repeat protein